MQMTLLPITAWFAHFLIASAFNFNTLPSHTLNDYTENISLATTTNHQPKTLIKPTPSMTTTTNLPTEVHNQPNTTPILETTTLSQEDTTDGDVSIIPASHVSDTQNTTLTNFAKLTPQKDENNKTLSYNDNGQTSQPNTIPIVQSTQETTSLDQPNSSPSQNDMMDGDVSISNASDASYTNTRRTTPFTHLTSLMVQKDRNTETGTMPTVSSSDDGYTSQTNTIPNVASTQETTFLLQLNSSLSQNETMDGDVSISNASDSTNFRRLRPQKDEYNETSYNDFQTPDPFNNVSTWTEKEDEVTKYDEGNYETNPTQATFANASNQLGGTQATEGSYNFTNEHRKEHYNTTVHTINVQTDWPTSQNTDIPITTPQYTISQDPAVTDEPEYHTSTGSVNYSTSLQDLFRFTHTESENMTGTDTPVGTTNNDNNNSTLTGTNATINRTETESKVWPTCLNSTQKYRMVCFITVWTLAMIATIFLGVTIFLWVRLSVVKEKIKRKERGNASEKVNLWTDPKASVQERVEFWYINGSTLEADRKEKDRKRQERIKKRGQEQVNEENSLWIQPRVTVDDIT